MTMRTIYDYIIVGAGSAGCALAHRLTSNPNIRALLLEAGGNDLNPFVASPLGETAMLESKWDWNFPSEPEPMLDNNTMKLARGKELGHREIRDFNSGDMDGFGYCQHTHYKFPLLRCSSSYAYLLKERRRPNLTICKHAEVERVLIEDGAAKGVAYRKDGLLREAFAAREVILSAGAYMSSKLLLLSGIGPKREIEAVGVKCINDLPGVGKNLKDQIGTFVQHYLKEPISYFRYTKLHQQVIAAAQWLLLGRGPLTVFPMNCSAFLRSEEGLRQPDVQFYLFPVAVNPYVDDTYDTRFHGFNIHWGQIHPESAGEITLRSNNPADQPRIVNNFFTAEKDRQVNRWAFRMARQMMATQALSRFSAGEETPGHPCETDEEIDALTRRYFANHYHAAGSNKMGPASDKTAVVSPELKVHGIERLRVADVSIMPRMVTGGFNIPATMVGEKCSDMVLADYGKKQ